MSKTVVGLFQNSAVADQVVHDLAASSFPLNEIRSVREPLDMGATGATGTPRLDFEVRLERELTVIGASVGEANAYAQGVKRGGVLVFATGTNEEVEAASEIMNRLGAANLEDFAGVENMAALGTGPASPSSVEAPSQAGRVREQGAGARLFVW